MAYHETRQSNGLWAARVVPASMFWRLKDRDEACKTEAKRRRPKCGGVRSGEPQADDPSNGPCQVRTDGVVSVQPGRTD
jgi:hypothetical protein